MNFFRKKDHIIATLTAEEVAGSSLKLIKDLKGLMPVPENAEVRLSLSGAGDISMTALAAIISFSKELSARNGRVSLTAGKELIERLEKYNFGKFFDSFKVADAS